VAASAKGIFPASWLSCSVRIPPVDDAPHLPPVADILFLLTISVRASRSSSFFADFQQAQQFPLSAGLVLPTLSLSFSLILHGLHFVAWTWPILTSLGSMLWACPAIGFLLLVATLPVPRSITPLCLSTLFLFITRHSPMKFRKNGDLESRSCPISCL